ncbi:MAG: SDR family NAD(P)-dependent oxidoreductase [Actinobacteria bacterium]|nr:SDR family NAD(P)-dependent oxidoreductase [Actinomycetota bacterium]
MERILITGGAGFIGSHTADLLIKNGYEVRIFDNLEEKVHKKTRPSYLNAQAEFIEGDVRDYDAVQKVLSDVDVVLHYAAAVGVGISMYDIINFTSTNSLGTANLLDVIIKNRDRIRMLIVASSASVYGELAYRCAEHGTVYPKMRTIEQMDKKQWEANCPICGKQTTYALTREDKPKEPTSIYGIGKNDQEEMCLLIGKTYGIPSAAFRFMAVYGPRQALSNPYTGIAPIFIVKLLKDMPPMLYEDGNQVRDLVHVRDVARLNLMAIQKGDLKGEAYNVGTSRPLKLADFAKIIAKSMDKDIEPALFNSFRKGDVRHIVADITKVRQDLGWEPVIPIEDGVMDLLDYVLSLDRNELIRFVEEHMTTREVAEGKGMRI